MRRLIVRAHLWLGLALGLLWALQGLTGALLVFHREYDRATLSVSDQSPPLPFTAIAAAAQSATGLPAQRIGTLNGRDDVLTVDYSDAAGTSRSLFVEASSGRVLARRETEPSSPFSGSATRWLYLLHQKLLMGDRGETLVGLSGLLLLSSLGMGMWLGWPRSGKWKAVFSASSWRNAGQRLYGWHRLLGLTLGALLMLTVPGGAYIVFSAELRPMVARVAAHELPFRQPSGTLTGAPLSADAAWAKATSLFPGARFVRLTYPSPSRPTYEFRLWQKGELRAWSGATTVTVHAVTGQILHAYDPLKAPFSNKLGDAAFSIHNGEIGGLPGRLIVLLSGLALATMFVTGVWSWWRKRKRKGRSRRKAPVEAIALGRSSSSAHLPSLDELKRPF